MCRSLRLVRVVTFGLLLIASAAMATEAPVDRQRDWWQWGGPTRDFTTTAPRLAPSWQGTKTPVELFRHELAGGHSAVAVAANRVLVVHGASKTENVLALSVRGDVLWQRPYRVDYGSSIAAHDGPHAAPLVLDDRVITVAIDATVRAWDVIDGTLLWLRDLRRDHGLTLPQAGYAASPLLVGDSILLPGLGGDGPDYSRTEAAGLGVLRLDTRTGRTLWAKHGFPSSHASAILVSAPVSDNAPDSSIAVFHGMEQLVAIRPETGQLLWRHPLRNGAADNVSFTPVWDSVRGNLLVSHAYDSRGAQAIHIDPEAGVPRRSWSNPRLKVEHGNGLLWQDMLLASDGSEPGFLVALDAATGALLWKERVPKATLLGIKEQAVIMLDSDGTLYLARPTRNSSGIASRLDVLDKLSWTAPTLVGRILLIRDPQTLVALRLP